MADYDVFTRNVHRPWCASSRSVFSPQAPDVRALTALLRVAAKQLKDHGCPGFDVIAEMLSCGAQERDVINALRFIESRGIAGKHVEALRAVAYKSLDARSRRSTKPPVYTLNAFAQEVVLEVIMRACGSAALLNRLIADEGWSHLDIHRRRAEIVDQLRDHPMLAQVAEQLAADPTGKSIVIPRSTAPRASQEDLLRMPLV